MTYARSAIVLAAAVSIGSPAAPAQTASLDHHTALIMLRNARHLLRRHYFDSTYGGVNMDSLFRAAEQRMDSARDNGERFALIADVVLRLNDSHTMFWPPNRAALVEYGFGVTLIGDTGYVEVVTPASDAWMQGLRPGDRVLGIERHRVNRSTLRMLEYLLTGLAPRGSVELLVAAPDSAPRVVRVASRVTERMRILDISRDWGPLIRRWEDEDQAVRQTFASVGDVLIWRLSTFSTGDDEIRDGLNRARRHRSLILDLRGNSGGYVSTVRLLAGGLVGPDTIIAIEQERRRIDTVRTRRAPRFTGDLIILTDYGSASASEVLAGLVQFYSRGIVVGDRSRGAVMKALGFGEAVGTNHLVLYGFSITVSDFRLPNGQRLEHEGVTPDEIVLPSGSDISAGRDPVLARALEHARRPTTPAAAGMLLPPRPSRALLWRTR